jgi:hypothetical protein
MTLILKSAVQDRVPGYAVGHPHRDRRGPRSRLGEPPAQGFGGAVAADPMQFVQGDAVATPEPSVNRWRICAVMT